MHKRQKPPHQYGLRSSFFISIIYRDAELPLINRAKKGSPMTPRQEFTNNDKRSILGAFFKPMS